jgi:hypothetical protein
MFQLMSGSTRLQKAAATTTSGKTQALQKRKLFELGTNFLLLHAHGYHTPQSVYTALKSDLFHSYDVVPYYITLKHKLNNKI